MKHFQLQQSAKWKKQEENAKTNKITKKKKYIRYMGVCV